MLINRLMASLVSDCNSEITYAFRKVYMSFLFALPKILIDLSLGLLKIKKDDRTRQRLADLLASVADCVSSIGDQVSCGTHSASLCAELEEYISNIEQFFQSEIGDSESQKLAQWLCYVGDVPGLAKIDRRSEIVVASKPKWTKAGRLAHAESIWEIAGLIRGTAKLIRV